MSGRVAQVFADVLRVPVEDVNDDMSPDNTSQWDSKSSMELALAIEDAFSIRLSTKEIVSMRTVGIVKKVLRNRGVTDI
jgi:acyl carrier protein